MVMASKYKHIHELFVEQNGNQPVTLFAILKMDELVDRWSILVSASWITADNRKTYFSSLINLLQNELSSEELNEIARIVFYSPEEHLIELFLDNFESGQHIKEDARVNGNVIHEGYIIALNNDARTTQSTLFAA